MLWRENRCGYIVEEADLTEMHTHTTARKHDEYTVICSSQDMYIVKITKDILLEFLVLFLAYTTLFHECITIDLCNYNGPGDRHSNVQLIIQVSRGTVFL